MQHSDQSPEEKESTIHTPPPYSEQRPSAELPSEQSAQGTSSDSLPPEDQHTSARSHTETTPEQQQPAYPPPPSFYQQQLDKEMSQVENKATPPPTQPDAIPTGDYSGSPWQHGIPYAPQQPMPGYPTYQQGGAYPGMPAPYMPPSGPGRPKESKKWLTLLISVLLVITVVCCGLCVWAGGRFFGGVYNQASDLVIGSQTLVDNYYGALQNQQYTEAYSYLHPQGSISGLTQAQFVKQAQQADKQYGPVLRYSSNQPTYKVNGSQLTDVTIVVTVGRRNKQYTVTLSIQKMNNQWKITNYNQL